MRVPVVRDILSANDQIARENRNTFATTQTFVVNLMASPGAGKTSLILATAARLPRDVRPGVIEGDLASRIDADTVAARGIPVVQINTGGNCHLDAPMIRAALGELPLPEIDLLFIENVGNLVCPAEFDLGADLAVVVAERAGGPRQAAQISGHVRCGRRCAAEQGRCGAGLRLRSGLLPPRRADGQPERAAVRRLVQVGRGHG